MRSRVLIAAICLLPLAAQATPDDARRTPVVIAVEQSSPAVVNIYTERLIETPFSQRSPFPSDPFFDDFFSDFFQGFPSPRTTEKRSSLGSGVVIRSDGTIVTNEHVIVRASNIRVQLADNREFPAVLTGADSDSDLAVLKVSVKKPLPFIPMAENDSVMIGETVIAIGNPYGLSHTVTTGVVSAVGRTIQAGDIIYHDFLQTDASINPGNSGGPLINVSGELIGINTAIHRKAEGIGFAIPISRVRNIVEQILHYGSVQAPWLGIQVQNLTPELAFHFGVEPGSGVLVRGIEPGSPAEEAGLARGSVITKVQGKSVSSAAVFARHTQGLTAGDRLRLGILSDGNESSLSITVLALPSDRIDDFAWRAMGLTTAKGGSENNSATGVVVDKVRYRGPAHNIGIREGDRITALGGREVISPDSFRRRLAAFRYSNSVLVSVVRGRRLYRVTLPLDKDF
ncbi:MAG: trypsin-like peptidase domain-containing protein [Deltaproteobacteria bacterium]